MKTKKNPQTVMRKKANTEFDSYAQCSSATGIPVAVLRDAKKNGCPAFRFSKIYLIEFLQWHFTRKYPVDVIDVPAEQAKIIRLQRLKLEREKLTAEEILVSRTEVEEEVWQVLGSFRSDLIALGDPKIDALMAKHNTPIDKLHHPKE